MPQLWLTAKTYKWLNTGLSCKTADCVMSCLPTDSIVTAISPYTDAFNAVFRGQKQQQSIFAVAGARIKVVMLIVANNIASQHTPWSRGNLPSMRAQAVHAPDDILMELGC